MYIYIYIYIYLFPSSNFLPLSPNRFPMTTTTSGSPVPCHLASGYQIVRKAPRDWCCWNLPRSTNTVRRPLGKHTKHLGRGESWTGGETRGSHWWAAGTWVYNTQARLRKIALLGILADIWLVIHRWIGNDFFGVAHLWIGLIFVNWIHTG